MSSAPSSNKAIRCAEDAPTSRFISFLDDFGTTVNFVRAKYLLLCLLARSVGYFSFKGSAFCVFVFDYSGRRPIIARLQLPS